MSRSLPVEVEGALEHADRKKLELAGVGSFAHVYKVPDTQLVITKALDHPVVGNLHESEKRIYERLGRHPFILRYYGEYRMGNGLPNGLVFRHHGRGTLAEHLALSKYADNRAEWPFQAAEALRYIRSKNIIHCDIGSHNFLIGDDGNLVLADFGGSNIDNEPGVASYSSRYARPTPLNDDSVSLPSTIYSLLELSCMKSPRQIDYTPTARAGKSAGVYVERSSRT